MTIRKTIRSLLRAGAFVALATAGTFVAASANAQEVICTAARF